MAVRSRSKSCARRRDETSIGLARRKTLRPRFSAK